MTTKDYVVVDNAEKIEQFKQAMQFDYWIVLEQWDMKESPSKFILVNEEILFGLLEIDEAHYIKVTYNKSSGKKTQYDYYKVPLSIVEFFNDNISN